MTEARYFFKKLSSGEQIPLAPVMSIGRGEDSALRLVNGQPSRHHAQVNSESGNVFIEDLGSVNGTFVNGQRLDARVRVKLMAGDRVRFDIEEFEFIAPTVAAPTDADKTVFRAPVPEKTVLRAPAPAVAGSEAPRRIVAEPRRTDEGLARANPSAAEKVASGKADLPGAFMDPSGKETVYFDSKQRKNIKSGAAASSALALVDTPCLWVVSGDHTGQKIELRTGAATKGAWSIGSGEDRDVRLQDPGVSAIHATLRNENRTWQLTDDVSANGTFVNDRKVLKSYLSDGDRLRLGPVECVFRAPPQAVKREAGGWRKIALIVTAAFLITLAVLFALMKVL